MKKDKYDVVVIDDEEKGIRDVYHSLKNYEQFRIAGTTQKADIGKELILSTQPDLVFLDVEMPEMTGLELVREIKENITWPMQVVFYTAYDKYLLEALRESAFDYLLKPYEEEEFAKVIRRYLEYAENATKQKSFEEHVYNLYNQDGSYFFITTFKGFRRINMEDVGYYEYDTENKLWMIVLRANETIKLKRNISSDDILALSENFIQISNKQIINIAFLKSIESKKCIMSEPFDQVDHLIISRKYLDAVQEKFFML
jgi:two-component system LytT family response regulator